MTNQLLTFHGKESLKQERVALVRAHREADLLIQGATGNPANGEKGCAVACTVNGYDHYRYPEELGLPVPWAYLEDAIFEGLSKEDAAEWPTQFLEAVPVGVDLWPTYHRVIARVLRELSKPTAKSCGEPEATLKPVLESIEQIAVLHDEAARGDTVSLSRVYWDTYYEYIDRSAAWSAAESAADAAWSAAWKQISQIVLEELRTTEAAA
jgi:hypothetical protein